MKGCSNIRLIGFACLVAGFLLKGPALRAQDSSAVQVTHFSAQKDTFVIDTIIQKGLTDTLAAKPFVPYWDSLQKVHSPRRAALYSAVLPGLGQIYNHQYIKAPLMWGGIGVATGVFIFNFDHYITFRDAYRLRLNGKYTGDPRIDIYGQQDLKYIRDGYRQYVDYSVLGFAAVYLYNILDAVVFGYLYSFDVASPLARVKFGPIVHQEDSYLGFGFTYNF